MTTSYSFVVTKTDLSTGGHLRTAIVQSHQKKSATELERSTESAPAVAGRRSANGFHQRTNLDSLKGSMTVRRGPDEE